MVSTWTSAHKWKAKEILFNFIKCIFLPKMKSP